MNEEQKNDPKPERVYPYEQWWLASCREVDALKEKLANAETMMDLALTEIRRLKGEKS